MAEYTGGILHVEPEWQADPHAYKPSPPDPTTAGCPCTGCEWESRCQGQCSTFKRWVENGAPRKRKKG